MNKNLLFIVFAVLACLGLLGYVVVLLLRPEQAVAYFASLVTVLGLVATSATTFFTLGRQQATLEEVRTNTNGNTSRMLDENARLQREKDELARQLLAVVGNSPPVTQ